METARAEGLQRGVGVAALFVERGGAYWGLEGVDAWDEARDARRYEGPWPVVAHPPCARWSRLAGLVEARWGHRKGDDGGCFEAALRAVREWGGVLEHPAYSDAWREFGLPVPDRRGGWQAGICGGASCHVEQWRYGHPAKKATWLYVHGVRELPALRWGHIADADQEAAVKATVSWCGSRPRGEKSAEDAGWANRRRLTPKEASGTPESFRDELVGIARRVEFQSKGQRVVTPPEFRDVLLEIARGAEGG